MAGWRASCGDRWRIACAAVDSVPAWPDAALFIAEAVSSAAVLDVTLLPMCTGLSMGGLCGSLSLGHAPGSDAHHPGGLASCVSLPPSSEERPRTVARKAIGDWPVRWWKNLLKLVALVNPSCVATRAAD